MKIWIDSDGGVDDVLALAMALGLPNVRVIGASAVFGNVTVDRAASNLGSLIAASNAKIPVIRGADAALDGRRYLAEHVHGEDGLWGATGFFPAGDCFVANATPTQAIPVNQMESQANDIGLLGIGPATNLSLALQHTRLSSNTRIVLMAGAFRVAGNITPSAEFNAYADPGALADVLHSGINPTVVGLDVCTKVMLPRSFLAKLDDYRSSSAASGLKRALSGYMDFYQQAVGIDGCYPHDAVALAVLVNRELFEFEQARIKVHSDNDKRGMTEISQDGEPAEIATDIDKTKFFNMLDAGLARFLEMSALEQ